MGIFNRFSKGKNEKAKEMQYSMKMQDGGDNEILIYDIERQENISHSNDDIMQLIMARITKFHKNQTINYEMSDFIAFEIPIDEDINKELMQAVMQQYVKEETAKQPSKGLNNYYLGRAVKDKEGYDFDRKSVIVEHKVASLVEEQIREKLKSMVKNDGETFRSRIKSGANNANEYLEYMKKIRQNRIDHPYVRVANLTESAKAYVNYNGINVNTGDILRIRNVNKVGKDGDGTYLYSAHIYNTPNLNDDEKVDKNGTPRGFYVCFELQKRLEDIVKDDNTEEVEKVLQLLSNERNFHDSDKLRYIGEIDKNGQVNYREESSSNAIRMKIEEMKKEYDARMKQQSK